MHADPIQNEIEAKGLTAPRVTPADIEAETGEFVTRGYAETNPATTVKES